MSLPQGGGAAAAVAELMSQGTLSRQGRVHSGHRGTGIRVDAPQEQQDAIVVLASTRSSHLTWH